MAVVWNPGTGIEPSFFTQLNEGWEKKWRLQMSLEMMFLVVIVIRLLVLFMLSCH
jgi:hypothetical protein